MGLAQHRLELRRGIVDRLPALAAAQEKPTWAFPVTEKEQPNVPENNAPRSAQARAAEDCTLLVLFRGDFMGLMESHGLIASKIAMQLARYLGARLRNAAQAQPSVL